MLFGSRTSRPRSSWNTTVVPSPRRYLFRRLPGMTICPLELITAVDRMAYLYVGNFLLHCITTTWVFVHAVCQESLRSASGDWSLSHSAKSVKSSHQSLNVACSKM